MRVFVTGASGYVGFAVATAFRRAGHDVYGLTRAAAKAPQLARQEIRPVIGDIGDPKSYADTAEDCSVLVHAAFEPSASGVAKDKTAVDALIEAGRRGSQPKTLIYTSGVWVHGDSGEKLVDETSPLDPIKLVAWRQAHEQLVLQAKGVRGLVMRLGCVYGGRGGLTGDWFAAATAGEVFDVTDRSRATVLEMATAAARAAGFQGELRPVPLGEARRTMGDFADALAVDQHVDARNAVRLLGWQPRHGGFVDEADIFYAAWKAWRA